MILIDSNVLLDVWQHDPVWFKPSIESLKRISATDEIAINPIVFAEFSVRFPSQADVEQALSNLSISLLSIPIEAAFLAGKAHLKYRQQGGTKTGTLPDFFIGAHAQVLSCPLLTRDTARYTTYFPSVVLITP
jgi:predicted nucleic acid-binding protein